MSELKTRYIRSDEEFLKGKVRLQNINYPLGQFLAELTSYNSIDNFCKEFEIEPSYVIKGLLELATVINSNEFKELIIGAQEIKSTFSEDYRYMEYEYPKEYVE